MAFKMKNPGMGKTARAAGSPHKFGIAGEMRGVDSVSRGREGMDTKSPMKRPKGKKAKTDDSMVIEGSREQKRAERRQKREAKKQEKQDVKKYGSAENAERNRKKQEDARNKDLVENAEARRRQGKQFATLDEGESLEAGAKPNVVRAERTGTSSQGTQGAVSRETLKRRKANEGMTAEEHDKMAKDYFSKKRAEREGGEGAPLTKKKSALKNYKKGYYGVK